MPAILRGKCIIVGTKKTNFKMILVTDNRIIVII